VASVLVDDYVQGGPNAADPLTGQLTAREREVLTLLAEGKPSKEIAMLLRLSVQTVDACRRRTMQKVGAQSIADLVKYAIRAGLTSVNNDH
jgi:DNA-binding CsgD family transcriptional regulator